MSTQQANLDRVRLSIGAAVLAFCRGRLEDNPEFFASELRAYISQRCLVAPASPDRILRALRQQGKLRYYVVRRAKSLYRVVEVLA